MLKPLLSLPLGLAAFFALCVALVKAVVFFSSQRTHDAVYGHGPRAHNTRFVTSDVFKTLLYDVLLVGVFIVPHSVMSSHLYKDLIGNRLGFLQRTVFVLITGITLTVLGRNMGSYYLSGFHINFPSRRRRREYVSRQFLLDNWNAVSGWDIWFLDPEDYSMTSFFFSLVHVVAWCVLFLEHAMLEPFYLIGIKQVYYRLFGESSPWQYMSKRFQSVISHMPHPGVTCFLVILWVYPHMTLDRWLLSTLLTWYTCLMLGGVTKRDYLYVKEQSEQTRLKVM